MQTDSNPSDRFSDATGRPLIDLQAPPFTRLEGSVDFDGAKVEIFLANGEISTGKLMAFDMHGDEVALRQYSAWTNSHREGIPEERSVATLPGAQTRHTICQPAGIHHRARYPANAPRQPCLSFRSTAADGVRGAPGSGRGKPAGLGKIDKVDLELRIATLPTAGGIEDVVIRLLSSGKALPVRGIGLSTPDLESLLDLVSHQHGLLLVCGPTGSGKTTTLHSVLAHLNTHERKIWTAEDPVEITQPGLRQVQINTKTGLTYEIAMRAFLRADPDVIMIGEMRDLEASDIAIEASLTGHLVLSTLHTNGAAETVTRLLEMGIDEFNFSDSLLGVLSQRLVKTLCVSCKTAYLPSDQEVLVLATEYLRELPEQQDGDSAKQALVENWRERYFSGKDVILFRPTGCKECTETGYRGRIGVYELLRATARIKEMILHKASVAELEKVALADGMMTRKQDGIVKVIKGLTDFSQVRTL